MVEVPLVDLEVIVRYSLAIRQETAPADELLAVLEATIDHVRGLAGTTAAPAPPSNRRVRSAEVDVEPEPAPLPAPPPGAEAEADEIDFDGPAFAGVGDDAAFGGLPSPDAEEDLWPEPVRRIRRPRRARS